MKIVAQRKGSGGMKWCREVDEDDGIVEVLWRFWLQLFQERKRCC